MSGSLNFFVRTRKKDEEKSTYTMVLWFTRSSEIYQEFNDTGRVTYCGEDGENYTKVDIAMLKEVKDTLRSRIDQWEKKLNDITNLKITVNLIGSDAKVQPIDIEELLGEIANARETIEEDKRTLACVDMLEHLYFCHDWGDSTYIPEDGIYDEGLYVNIC